MDWVGTHTLLPPSDLLHSVLYLHMLNQCLNTVSLLTTYRHNYVSLCSVSSAVNAVSVLIRLLLCEVSRVHAERWDKVTLFELAWSRQLCKAETTGIA